MSRPTALLPEHTDPLTLARGRAGRPPTWRASVLFAIREHPGATVAELARLLNARRARVRSAIRELAADGLIVPVAWSAHRVTK